MATERRRRVLRWLWLGVFVSGLVAIVCDSLSVEPKARDDR